MIKQIYIDEAVNGFMLTIMWDNDQTIKEVFESKADLLVSLSRWVSKKFHEEATATKKAVTLEVI